MSRLLGRHAVITGAGRGIGRAIALQFANHGASLTLWSRTQSQLDAVAAEVETIYQRNDCKSLIATHVVDVRNSDSVDKAAAVARQRNGAPSIIINNAGSVIRGDAFDMTNQQWRDTFATNIDGTFFVTRAFAMDIKAGKVGSNCIINIASIAGRQGTAGLAAYCAAKHAVVGFTRALALELKGIATVNAICPGSVDTQMLQEGLPGAIPDMTPTDIANTAFFLAADAPAALTGTCIDVFG